MKTIKVSEASGLALDWLAAKAEGDLTRYEGCEQVEKFLRLHSSGPLFGYSVDWEYAGPIIEREGIGTSPPISADPGCNDWLASDLVTEMYGPTPLIAAMRCYVASKFGDEVEVPEELLS